MYEVFTISLSSLSNDTQYPWQEGPHAKVYPRGVLVSAAEARVHHPNDEGGLRVGVPEVDGAAAVALKREVGFSVGFNSS